MAASLPPGRFRPTAALDDRVRRMAEAPARGGDGAAHPVFAFVLALGGMGRTIDQIAGSLGLDFGRGPVLGRCDIVWQRPIRVDRAYDVRGRVVDLRRKASRRFGAADHLTLAIALSEGDAPVAETTLLMIAPAGPPAAAPAPEPAPQVPDGPAPRGRRFGPATAADMAAWCRILRDENAIHLDPAAAARAGFGHRRVNPGPANLAWALTHAMAHAPEARPAQVAARFLGNVQEGDVVAAACRPADGGLAAELRRLPDGAPVLSATIRTEPAG